MEEKVYTEKELVLTAENCPKLDKKLWREFAENLYALMEKGYYRKEYKEYGHMWR